MSLAGKHVTTGPSCYNKPGGLSTPFPHALSAPSSLLLPLLNPPTHTPYSLAEMASPSADTYEMRFEWCVRSTDAR